MSIPNIELMLYCQNSPQYSHNTSTHPRHRYWNRQSRRPHARRRSHRRRTSSRCRFCSCRRTGYRCRRAGRPRRTRNRCYRPRLRPGRSRRSRNNPQPTNCALKRSNIRRVLCRERAQPSWLVGSRKCGFDDGCWVAGRMLGGGVVGVEEGLD